MKKGILYFLLIISSAYQIKAQGENNFLVGSEVHLFSDWKNIQQMPLWQPCLNYVYVSKENFFFSSEVSWAKYQREYNGSSMPFNDKRSIINFDNNVGYRLNFLKNGSLSFNLSIGISFRNRVEDNITDVYGYGLYSTTEYNSEAGYNIRASVKKRFGKYLNASLFTVLRNYSKGPNDIALGATVGCLISDLPLNKEKESFNDSYNRIALGLQSHYFFNGNLPKKNAMKSNIPLIGKKQLNLSYYRCSKTNFTYSLDISSSSYNDSGYSGSSFIRSQYIFNVDNNLGYCFHIKQAPTLSLSISGGISIRRRKTEDITQNYYYYPLGLGYNNGYTVDTLDSEVDYDLGLNLKTELDKRIGKYIVIGASVIYRAYLWSFSELAFGCHIAFQFGYTRKEKLKN